MKWGCFVSVWEVFQIDSFVYRSLVGEMMRVHVDNDWIEPRG